MFINQFSIFLGPNKIHFNMLSNYLFIIIIVDQSNFYLLKIPYIYNNFVGI